MSDDTHTVLVAVTDIFFYAKIRDALRSEGYNLERACCQDEVLTLAIDRHPLAIILNMNDVKLDALPLLEQLKQDEQSRNIPVLAFANHEETELWRRARELGVSKIVSRNEFSARTKELLKEVIARQSSLANPSLTQC